MKIEKPKRYYKKVSYGDGLPLVFSYHHLPLVQKILDFKDTDMAIAIGVPIFKLRRTLQMTEPLPERINTGVNNLLIDRFGTANICWIALNTWVDEDWGNPELVSNDDEFSCRYVHLENGFELACDSVGGFRIGVADTGETLDGTYGFSQVNPFFNVLDEMVKVDSSEWVEFWAQAQVARKIDLEQKIVERTQLAAESLERRKAVMSNLVASIEKEALEGGADAKYSAGRALAMGIGMDQPDLEKAAYWLAIATAEGHFQAGKLLTKVKKTVQERARTLQ